MAAINLTIEVPEAYTYDISLLRKQLTEFARILVSTASADTKTEPVAETNDPFSCFSGDWGGDKSAHEISDELRGARNISRTVDAW